MADEIYSQALSETQHKINNLGFFSSILNGIFGESEHSIASQVKDLAVDSVWPIILKKLISLIIVFLAYVIIFRICISPILIKNATNLNNFGFGFVVVRQVIIYFLNGICIAS